MNRKTQPAQNLEEKNPILSEEIRACLTNWGMDARCHAMIAPYAGSVTPGLIRQIMEDAHFDRYSGGGAKASYLADALKERLGGDRAGPACDGSERSQRQAAARLNAEHRLNTIIQNLEDEARSQGLVDAIKAWRGGVNDEKLTHRHRRALECLGLYASDAVKAVARERSQAPLDTFYLFCVIAYDLARPGPSRSLLKALG